MPKAYEGDELDDRRESTGSGGCYNGILDYWNIGLMDLQNWIPPGGGPLQWLKGGTIPPEHIPWGIGELDIDPVGRYTQLVVQQPAYSIGQHCSLIAWKVNALQFNESRRFIGAGKRHFNFVFYGNHYEPVGFTQDLFYKLCHLINDNFLFADFRIRLYFKVRHMNFYYKDNHYLKTYILKLPIYGMLSNMVRLLFLL